MRFNNINIIDTEDWTIDDLKKYGFAPYKYCTFRNRIDKIVYNIFGTIFSDDRITNYSDMVLEYESYSIQLDELGYIDLYYKDEHLCYFGRRHVNITSILNIILEHKRNISLSKLLK